MKKTFMISLVVAALVCAFALPNLSAANEAPADIELKAPFKMRKAPVQFPHAAHEKLVPECTTCHHEWDGKSEVMSCAAEGCHNKQRAKRGETLSFKKAYHDLCIKCHRQERKGPKGCNDCHPREKK